MPRSSGVPAPSAASRISAPAPSPNSTQVERSLKSRMREKVSAPITITRRTEPPRISASAWASAKTKPAQTAWMSKANPPRIPMALCTFTAAEGNVWSGVAVATIRASMSAPVRPPSASAPRAAAIARSEVSSPSAAKCRRSMPVRVRIHSSEVSRVRANSAFSTTRAGR